jgi:hypothetical protein
MHDLSANAPEGEPQDRAHALIDPTDMNVAPAPGADARPAAATERESRNTRPVDPNER